MGTGGKPKIDTQGDGRKLRAIETLVRHGKRGSEWQEAGLLNAIEQVLNGHDVSSDSLKLLMEKLHDTEGKHENQFYAASRIRREVNG